MHTEPFNISVSDPALTDLMDRLSRARWPDQLHGIGWEQGTDRAYPEGLVNHWQSGFDWRAQEAALNELAQFRATIGDQQIHFVHERAKSGRGLPIIITHGWPDVVPRVAPGIPVRARRSAQHLRFRCTTPASSPLAQHSTTLTANPAREVSL
jgi:hypothetical protein